MAHDEIETVTIERQADGAFWVQVLDAGTLVEGAERLGFRFEERDGTLVCTGLHLATEEPLSARGLHELPFGALRDQAVEWAALKSDATPPEARAARRRGSHGHDDAFYAEVADLYRYALRWHPRSPVKWIAEAGHRDSPVSPDTVRSWLRKARRLGHLGAATAGKAGEGATT